MTPLATPSLFYIQLLGAAHDKRYCIFISSRGNNGEAKLERLGGGSGDAGNGRELRAEAHFFLQIKNTSKSQVRKREREGEKSRGGFEGFEGPTVPTSETHKPQFNLQDFPSWKLQIERPEIYYKYFFLLSK